MLVRVSNRMWQAKHESKLPILEKFCEVRLDIRPHFDICYVCTKVVIVVGYAYIPLFIIHGAINFRFELTTVFGIVEICTELYMPAMKGQKWIDMCSKHILA